MTVSSLFSDMIIIALFMLIGFFAREIIKPIQRLFLPASLIGGLIALISGQQMLGIIEVPASFSSFSNVLIAPIMAALLFGVTINRKKIVGFLDYICVEQAIYGMQMCLGAGLGAALALLWPGLPLGWGSMGVFAFQGGHGNAGAAGQTYTELGIPENLSIGMVLATFGLIVAMLAGMIMVNVGVRRGWSKFVRDPQKQPSWYYGGAIVWNAARLVKLEHFIDVKFIHQMSGFLLEVVVLTAMATLDLELISTFIIPIVVYTLICSSVTLMIAFGGCKLFCREEWFEKALMAYGVGTGNTATGLALVRAVDPDSPVLRPGQSWRVQRSYVLEGSLCRSGSCVDDDRPGYDHGRGRHHVRRLPRRRIRALCTSQKSVTPHSGRVFAGICKLCSAVK